MPRKSKTKPDSTNPLQPNAALLAEFVQAMFGQGGWPAQGAHVSLRGFHEFKKDAKPVIRTIRLKLPQN